MKTLTYTHLHLHTTASLLDGIIKIPELMDYCKDNNMLSVGISDHGVLSNVIEFYKEAKRKKIRPIIGVEAYLTSDADNLPKSEMTRDNNHLLLIAKNNQGLTKLFELVSNAALNNFYYKPRISRENLKLLSGDVICSSACLSGPLARSLEFIKDDYGVYQECRDKDGLFYKNLNYLEKIFGKDLFLEVQVWNDGTHIQQVYNEFLLKAGKERRLPFLLTADAHYLRAEDYETHQLIMAMGLKKTLKDYKESGDMNYSPNFYVGTPDEMLKRAKSINCEEAFFNTNKIAALCNVDIELGNIKFPIFDFKSEVDYLEFLDWRNSNHSNSLECCSVGGV